MKPNNLFKKLLTLCFSIVILTATNAQTYPQKITSVEGITEYKLANGLEVLLFPDPSKPNINVRITYLVGSRLEGYGETGMAHLLEHMMLKGSSGHPNVTKEESAHGANYNADTWFDRTSYYETFPAADENLKWALDLESDRMVNSFIAAKDLKSEFSVVRNEFEMDENNSPNILEERVFSTAYLWHNYGKSTIGSKEDIERVPAERLKIFYTKYYQPDNAVLMITGKIDEAKALQLVTQYFGSIPKPTRVLDQSYTVEPVQDGERSVTLRRVGDVQVVSCGYHIVSASHPDFAAIDILNTILSDKPSGRLYKALVETKKASGIWSTALGLKDPGYIYFSADVLKEKNLDDAKNALLGELDSLSHKPITSGEVERARNSLLNNFELRYRNSETISQAIREFIADGDWRLAFIYRDNLKKVTVDDVNRVANAYFKSSNRTVGEFIPEKNPDRAMIPSSPDVDALVKNYKGQQGLVNAEAFDASPTNIDKRTKTGTIAGGAKYALLTKTTRGSTVNAMITLRVGDETSLMNKQMIATFTAQMLRRGTQSKTYQQLNDSLDKLQSTVAIDGRGQTVTITIVSIKNNFEKVLNLVNEMLHKPGFTQKEFEALQQEKLGKIDQQKSEPFDIAINTIERILYPYPKDDINYVMTFEEQREATQSMELEDVKSFYTDFYNGANATTSVVGDIDSKGAIQQLNAILQKWSSPKTYTRIKDKYFNVTASDQKINTPDKKNAWFFADENLQMNDADPEYIALMIGNFILGGGGGLHSRLIDRIRQKDGISYGVGSWVWANALDNSGGYGSYAIYNPQNLERLDKAYKEVLDTLLKAGITTEELKNAKSGILQSRMLDNADDSKLVSELNNHLYLNRTMAWDENENKRIEALTVEEVNAALRKYISPEKLVYVKAGDFNSANGNQPANK